MIIHVVAPGDSVWSIASKYGVSQSRIISDNAISNPRNLVVGQALIVLRPAIIHTVRRGDTLSAIAREYSVTTMELMQNNPGLALNPVLTVGRQITVSFTEEKRGTVDINGYAYPHIDRNVLRKTLPYLTRLTIFGYGFTTEGELIPINDEPLIRLALEFKAAPFMLISSITEDGNFSGERASLLFRDVALQNKVLDRIIITMRQKGYHGLDVDFEYIEPRDAEFFFAFLRNAAARLHAEGFKLHVDLAPKTHADQPGLLYEAHNYEVIGSIADTVMIMTYEWGYTFGPPMAVAPLNRVREVVEYAVTEIPVQKIFMGIPNYGYDWVLPYEQGNSRATSIGNEYAAGLAARYGAQIMFDSTAQSPYFNYWDRGGRKHIVWFEDVRSIQAKYGLIDEFRLLGGGYWTVMREFAQNWMYAAANYNIRKSVL